MESEQKGPWKPHELVPSLHDFMLCRKGQVIHWAPPMDLVPLISSLTPRGFHGVSHITVEEMFYTSMVQ